MAGNQTPSSGRAAGEPERAASASVAQYLGIGCFTAVAGFAGGGMIAVLVAKVVGALAKCPADADTGAPCHWLTYWFVGAVVGCILLPAIAISLLRRARRRATNSERG